jgi:DNA topoisomerase-1
MASWIRRTGPRHRFEYRDEHGHQVRDRRTLARIHALRVPPAWRDVHIARSPRSAIQAWGFDARGRKQYRYNGRAVELRELRKHHRVRQLAKELPRLRRVMERDTRPTARADALDVEIVAATVLRLISETFCRVGGERYLRENGTFGITTLRKSHVRVSARAARFVYRGKGKVWQRQVVADPALVRLIARQMRTPGARVFVYRQGSRWRTVHAKDVNAYLRRRAGAYSAKDFRTWGATVRAATVLAELGAAHTAAEAKRNVALAMRLVSSELGNTAAICRASYVHPMVIARYLDEGETISLARARRRAANLGRAHSPEERAVIGFLERHFPERRQAPRLET